jgi:uncharacterized NAD(P)/FAD-binding protein YdhS
MRIAIVGGGATGVLAALHLARALPGSATEIVLLEPAQAMGRGLAYATDDPRHLLNVRVANMSAFADRPDHLIEWLRSNSKHCKATDLRPFSFIPRGIYGAYLADLAGELVASGVVRHVRDRCVDLIENPDAVELRLEFGEAIAVEWAILATGNEAKSSLSGIPAVQPWAADSLGQLETQAPVLIIGSGLTMADVVLSLDRGGHRGKIIALSRHGCLASAHRPVTPITVAAEEVPFGGELSDLARWLRGLSATVTSKGGDWRSVVDALRPYTQRLWRSMSLVQRRRFLRHARAYWDVHRHRMAPEVETQISALIANGRIELVAGRVVHAEITRSGISVDIVRRGRSDVETCQFARLIDCAGVSNDLHQRENLLIRTLLAKGAARVDPLGIGLDIDENYALIDASQRHSRRVRAIGPLARAAFWECIAIPDIRSQCQNLAQMVAGGGCAGASRCERCDPILSGSK